MNVPSAQKKNMTLGFSSEFHYTKSQRSVNPYLGNKSAGQCVRFKVELTSVIVPHSTDHHQLV